MNNNIEHLIQSYTFNCGYTVEELKGKSRKREVADYRHLIWYLLLKMEYPVTKIAFLFDRKHPTVISGINKVKNLIETNDRQIKKMLETIEV